MISVTTHPAAWYQRLAAGVIKQAISDREDPRVTPEDAVLARCFLDGPELDFWCAVAGLDASYVRRLAHRK